jgi:hypothetical protein
MTLEVGNFKKDSHGRLIKNKTQIVARRGKRYETERAFESHDLTDVELVAYMNNKYKNKTYYDDGRYRIKSFFIDASSNKLVVDIVEISSGNDFEQFWDEVKSLIR